MRATRHAALPCDHGGGLACLSYGYYSGLVLPNTQDLQGCRFAVLPIGAPHGLFVHFAPPSGASGASPSG